MKKMYFSPETASLEMMAQDIICASGGGSSAPTRSGQISNMTQTNISI